jgi:uncharacterized protein (DUF427 family)
MSTAKHATASSGSAPAVARAMWNGVVLAETTRPVLLEGNVYFPPEDVRHEHLAATRHRSLCAWKGLARYYTVRAGGQQNTNAAWYYPHPSPLARKIKNHVAFWHRVQVDTGPAPQAQAVQEAGAATAPEADSAPATTSAAQGSAWPT